MSDSARRSYHSHDVRQTRKLARFGVRQAKRGDAEIQHCVKANAACRGNQRCQSYWLKNVASKVIIIGPD